MPDEPKGEQGDSEEALEAEVSEFEAALKKHVEESRVAPQVEEPLPEPSSPNLPTEEEIEKRLSRVIKEAEAYLGPATHDPIRLASEHHEQALSDESEEDGIHAEFSDRLHEVDGKLRRSRVRRETHHGKKNLIKETEAETARGLGMGLMAAYAIIGCPLVGAGIGYLVDRSVGGTSGVTIGTVVGAGIGMFAAITILNRTDGK